VLSLCLNAKKEINMKKIVALALLVTAGTVNSVSAWEGPFGVITNDSTINRLKEENERLREEAGEESEGTGHAWDPAGAVTNDAKIDALRADNKRLKNKIKHQEKNDEENED